MAEPTIGARAPDSQSANDNRENWSGLEFEALPDAVSDRHELKVLFDNLYVGVRVAQWVLAKDKVALVEHIHRDPEKFDSTAGKALVDADGFLTALKEDVEHALIRANIAMDAAEAVGRTEGES